MLWNDDLFFILVSIEVCTTYLTSRRRRQEQGFDVNEQRTVFEEIQSQGYHDIEPRVLSSQRDLLLRTVQRIQGQFNRLESLAYPSASSNTFSFTVRCRSKQSRQ